MEALAMIERLIQERNRLEDDLVFGPRWKHDFIRFRIAVVMRQVAGLMRLVEWRT